MSKSLRFVHLCLAFTASLTSFLAWAQNSPAGMRRVSGGQFWMGCAPQDPSCRPEERPGHWISIKSFWIDRKEVTVQQYAACVKARACSPPQAYQPDHYLYDQCLWNRRGKQAFPVNCITWFQAKQYCKWVHKRLPTEAQWERAARGVDQRIYPWGDQPKPSCQRAIFDEKNLSLSNTLGCGQGHAWIHPQPLGRSPYDVLALAGNLREWVRDIYEPDAYTRSPRPEGPKPCKHCPKKTLLRVVKGGSFESQRSVDLRISKREGYSPLYLNPNLGFRCARPIK